MGRAYRWLEYIFLAAGTAPEAGTETASCVGDDVTNCRRGQATDRLTDARLAVILAAIRE
jgi:hypothetical protein